MNDFMDFIKAGIGVFLFFWFLLFLFALWGGNPRGLYLQIKDRQQEINILQEKIQEIDILKQEIDTLKSQKWYWTKEERKKRK